MSTIELELVRGQETQPEVIVEDWRTELGLTEEVIAELDETFATLPELEVSSREAATRFNAVSEDDYLGFKMWGASTKRSEVPEADAGRYKEIATLEVRKSLYSNQLYRIQAVSKGVLRRLTDSMVPGRYQMGSGAYEFFEDKRGDGHLARIDYVADPQAEGQLIERKTCLSEFVPIEFEYDYNYGQGKDHVQLLADIIYGDAE